MLVLTAYDNAPYIFAFLEVGAAGYLLKDVSAKDLVRAIHEVYAGKSVLHPTVARKVVDHFSHPPKAESEQKIAALEELTSRQVEALTLAAKGMTNRDIAEQLAISVRTVQVHLSNVFSKLGVSSRTEAVLYALREGWIALEDTRQEGQPAEETRLRDEPG